LSLTTILVAPLVSVSCKVAEALGENAVTKVANASRVRILGRILSVIPPGLCTFPDGR